MQFADYFREPLDVKNRFSSLQIHVVCGAITNFAPSEFATATYKEKGDSFYKLTPSALVIISLTFSHMGSCSVIMIVVPHDKLGSIQIHALCRYLESGSTGNAELMKVHHHFPPLSLLSLPYKSQ